MPAPVEIDAERLRELWVAGYTAEAIAAHFGVVRVTVIRRAEKLGLRPRGAGWRSPGLGPVPRPPRREAVPERPPSVPPHPNFCAARDAEIAKSGGRYAVLSALAECWGLSLVQVQQRWHRIARGG